jgi:hypothetical protein
MTAAAAARPRDAAGRVQLPIRVEAKFRGTTGFRKYFATWDEAREWLAGDEFARTAPSLRSLVVTRHDPAAWPSPAEPTEPRKWMP